MAIPKIMGTETEYGVIQRDSREMDPVSISMLLVNSYHLPEEMRSIWDYAEENPLMDARGFEVKGEKDRPSPEDNRAINKVLPNGGRLYVDYAHPEYSTPECSNARDLVIFEKAGDRIMNLCRQRASQMVEGGPILQVYKNNSDGKGNSYGCHENYLMSRNIPFDKIAEGLTPFLVTRQVFTGAGKVGAENRGEPVAYQISQRADFFETHLGLDTMSNRPIINTRDEPHAAPDKYRRLHVIVGDSNMSEYTIYLKLGTTAIVLTLLEDGYLDDRLTLQEPVRAIKDVSSDLTLKGKIKLARGVEFRALDIQFEYLNLAYQYYSDNRADPVTADVLKKWKDTLLKLEDDPMQLSREIDWIIKRDLLETYMSSRGLSWEDHRVSMIDLQYHDIRPEKGLYYTLERKGYVERIGTDEEIAWAILNPPTDTRAYFRGNCLRRFPDRIYGVGWSSISFRADENTIKKVPMMEPGRGTKALVGEILERSATVEELLSYIGS